MREEIRAAIEEARAELAEHRDEIHAAIEQSRSSMTIAREAMAKARVEIDAARARGDFDHDFDFDFDVDKEVLEKLRQNGIDIKNTKVIRIREDESKPDVKLMKAARRCDEAEVRRLITDEKADVNAVFPVDGTPLIQAARRNCIDAARALLNAGADPEWRHLATATR